MPENTPNRLYPPMLLTTATLEDIAGFDDRWKYEIKFDGFRMEADIDIGQDEPYTKLWTREGNDFTHKVLHIVEQLPLAVRGLSAVCDGEMVAVDDHNVEKRGLLHMNQPPANQTTLYVFDLLELNGEPLVGWPLEQRYEALDKIFEDQPNVKRVPSYEHADLIDLVQAARENGHEGFVAKRRDAPYVSGKRRRHMLKHRFARKRL